MMFTSTLQQIVSEAEHVSRTAYHGFNEAGIPESYSSEISWTPS